MALGDLVFFGNHLYSYLISLGIIGVSIILGKILSYIFANILKKLAEKTASVLDDVLLEIMERPLVFFLMIGGLFMGYKRLALPPNVDAFMLNICKIMLIINVAWFVIRFIDSFIVHYAAPLTARTKSDLDDQLIPLIRKVIKWIIMAVTFIMILDNFGYDVGSLLAGLGLGGLAFALAAQDLLGNLFGGVSILTDSPFKLNQRVKFDGRDGHVREIGLRTTRVETLDGSWLTVPNAMLSKTIVENVSREKARRVMFKIGVTYDTSIAKLEKAKKIVHDIVMKHPNTKDNVVVGFSDFSASSLDILVIYWIKNLDAILGTKDAINMDIKRQYEKAKIDMAFPTQTIEYKKAK